MHVSTFKSIEMIIHNPLSSAFLEAIKAVVRPASLQNPANIMECPLSYTVWDEPWSERDICICTSKSGSNSLRWGPTYIFPKGDLLHASFRLFFPTFESIATFIPRKRYEYLYSALQHFLKAKFIVGYLRNLIHSIIFNRIIVQIKFSLCVCEKSDILLLYHVTCGLSRLPRLIQFYIRSQFYIFNNVT